jgi:hypothetical protein
MKLYRLIIITPTTNITRGVWADYIRVNDNTISFLDEFREEVAMYPIRNTIITSIETREQYDNRKSND